MEYATAVVIVSSDDLTVNDNKASVDFGGVREGYRSRPIVLHYRRNPSLDLIQGGQTITEISLYANSIFHWIINPPVQRNADGSIVPFTWDSVRGSFSLTATFRPPQGMNPPRTEANLDVTCPALVLGAGVPVKLMGRTGVPDIQPQNTEQLRGFHAWANCKLRPDRRNFTITNFGDALLEVTQVRLSSPAYSINPLMVAPLSPNDSINFTVTFAPVQEGIETATIELESNDPDEPVTYVGVGGYGGTTPLSYLHVDPLTPIHFTLPVRRTSPKRKTLMLRNVGICLPIEGLTVTLEGDESFRLIDQQSGPGAPLLRELPFVSLSPNSRRYYDIVYVPSGIRHSHGSIRITNPATLPIVIELHGEDLGAPPVVY